MEPTGLARFARQLAGDPTGRALLYAEPIYLQAQQSPMPELRLVVLALQDQLAYGTTFQAALGALFGGEASSLTASQTALNSAASSMSVPQTNSVPGQAQPDLNALINEANRNFEDYQRLTAAGKLAEAGQKLEALKADLAKLSSRK